MRDDAASHPEMPAGTDHVETPGADPAAEVRRVVRDDFGDRYFHDGALAGSRWAIERAGTVEAIDAGLADWRAKLGRRIEQWLPRAIERFGDDPDARALVQAIAAHYDRAMAALAKRRRAVVIRQVAEEARQAEQREHAASERRRLAEREAAERARRAREESPVVAFEVEGLRLGAIRQCDRDAVLEEWEHLLVARQGSGGLLPSEHDTVRAVLRFFVPETDGLPEDALLAQIDRAALLLLTNRQLQAAKKRLRDLELQRDQVVDRALQQEKRTAKDKGQSFTTNYWWKRTRMLERDTAPRFRDQLTAARQAVRAAETRHRRVSRSQPDSTAYHQLRSLMLSDRYYGDRCAWGSLDGEDDGPCGTHDHLDARLRWDHMPERGSVPGSHLRRGIGGKRVHAVTEWRVIRDDGHADSRYRFLCPTHDQARTSRQAVLREARKRAARA
jgi:hypothetical protein